MWSCPAVQPRVGSPADNARIAIVTLSPEQALHRQQHGAVLVDVREPHEHATGFPTGALCIARAELESQPRQCLPDPDAEILLICQAGMRSLGAGRAVPLAWSTGIKQKGFAIPVGW